VTYPPPQDPYLDPTRPYEQPGYGELAPYSPQPYEGRPYPGLPNYPPPLVRVAPAPTSGTAVAAMVLAIIGLVSGCCTFGIPSLLAIILGHVAVSETKSGAKSGHGMAVAGLVMGYLVVAPALVFSAWFLFAGGMAALSGS
jgi:hypothetical protein